MKTIGLLGGMSFESTAEYYRIINSEVRKRLGGNHSAKINLYSFNFQEIETLQFTNNWSKIADLMIDGAIKLEKNGVDFILICTNSVHKIFPQLEKELSVPLIHIADATSREIKKHDIKTVGLLGTKFTMEEDFYTKRLEQNGINIVMPDDADRKYIHKVIYDELCRGLIEENSRKNYENIIAKLAQKGAEGVILGCTEIPLLINQASTPLFNTTLIHALEAVNRALSEEQ